MVDSAQRFFSRGGGFLDGYEIHPVPSSGHVLQLSDCNLAVARAVSSQILAVDPTYRSMRPDRLIGRSDQPTPQVLRLLNLLRNVLSVPSPPGVDFSVALDWTTLPVEGADPSRWPLTATYRLIRQGKYEYASPRFDADCQRVGLELTGQLTELIRNHPAFSAADVIVQVPGHDSKIRSFGERLARAVARRLGIPLVLCENVQPFRVAAKEVEPSKRMDLMRDAFRCTPELRGVRAVVVDDLHGTGATLKEIARVVRDRGASGVATACAARTVRLG